jgi:hypothetical protein
MHSPELLPIKRLEDLHTDLIGRYEHGQFMVIQTPSIVDRGANVEAEAKVYIVRFLFQFSGDLISATHVVLPANAPEDKLQLEKLGLLQELQPVIFCDIAVKLFKLVIDNIVFGLIYAEETDSVTLEPRSIITFMAPWDGEYYT